MKICPKLSRIAPALLLSAAAFGHIHAQDAKPAAPPASQSQTPFLTPEEKREMRKNLVVKEMNADAKGRRRWLDHLTVWDENGYKIEETEYAVYGQRERVTFEYDASGRCIRENVYNDKNKLYRIRKYEYLENGRKKIQYNYNPDGKLYSTKIYEYSYQ
jgi:YD repeat-containing protein